MSRVLRRWVLVAVGAVVLAACGGAEQPGTAAGEAGSSTADVSVVPDVTEDEVPSESPTMGAMGDAAMGEAMEPEHDGAMDEDDHAEFSFGSPADPADAERTISVQTVEEGGFAYEPASIEVAVGETVTFEVTNVGEAVHEFVVGDAATQQAHEEEMAEMEMAHDEPNALSLQPGETKTLTWTFTEPRTLIYGCHEPGHYDAGMVGEITVR